MWEQLASFSFFTMLLALSPGPDNIFVMTQSLVNGFKSGLATTAGLLSGCIVHTTLLAFGVSALIAASEAAIWVIKIVGALYLCFLAFKVSQSDTQLSFNEKVDSKSYLTLYKTGVVMNLVNPKVLLFFLAFFPSFLWNETENTVFQFYILGLVFMLVSFFVFGGLALLAGQISNYMARHQKAGAVLKWLQVLVFVGIAIFILIP